MVKIHFLRMQRWRTPQQDGFALYEGASWYAKSFLLLSVIFGAGLIYIVYGKPHVESPHPLGVVILICLLMPDLYCTCKSLLLPVLIMSPEGMRCKSHADIIPWEAVANCACKERYRGLSILDLWFEIQITIRQKRKADNRRTGDSRVKLSPMGDITITLRALPANISPQQITELAQYYCGQKTLLDNG